MALYKQETQQGQAAPIACFQGWAIRERIYLFTKNTEKPKYLGDKTFHCVRRFGKSAIPGKCDVCKKDINKECFFIQKEYYSAGLMLFLIRVYEEGVKNGFSGMIWNDNKYYNDIIKAIEKPIPACLEAKQPKKDYFEMLEDKKDKIEEVPF